MRFRRGVRKAGVRKAGKGTRRVRRRGAAFGGTNKRAGIALVKEPSQFIPDRMFVPMTWKSIFENSVGGSTNASYLGYDNYALSCFGSKNNASLVNTIGTPNSLSGSLPSPFNGQSTLTGSSSYTDFMVSPNGGTNSNAYHMFGTLAKFYRNCRMYSSTIKVDISRTNAANETPAYTVAVFPLADLDFENSNFDTESVLQQPFVKFNNYSATKTGNKPLYAKAKVEKLMGISKMELKTNPVFVMDTATGLSSLQVNAQDPPSDVWWILHIADTASIDSTSAQLPAKTYTGTVQVNTMFEFYGRYNDLSIAD